MQIKTLPPPQEARIDTNGSEAEISVEKFPRQKSMHGRLPFWTLFKGKSYEQETHRAFALNGGSKQRQHCKKRGAWLRTKAKLPSWSRLTIVLCGNLVALSDCNFRLPCA